MLRSVVGQECLSMRMCLSIQWERDGGSMIVHRGWDEGEGHFEEC